MSAITAALGALKYVPASVGVKLLEKANPKFKNYFTTAAAYGYDVNNALDYLKDRFETSSGKSFKGQLEEGEARDHLRPDETQAKTQISNAEIPGKVLRSAAAFGGAALAGGLPGAIAQGASEIANQPQQKMEQPKSSDQAIRQYNQRQKQKKLTDQLREDFTNRYGEGRVPGQEQTNDPDMQALLQALQQLKQARGG